MLEIGCGWGAIAEAIGARRRAGHGDHDLRAAACRGQRADLRPQASPTGPRSRFEDYRDTAGSFDRIVSIEMIEAVGEENWPAYFDVVAERLQPGGRAVIQAITIREDLYDDYRRNPDFIQRYIFPGGMLPTVPMHAAAWRGSRARVRPRSSGSAAPMR